MNHRHWQPNPSPTRPLHTFQMPMADQYLGPICNSLLAGYLKQPCLQSGYQYQHHAGVHTATKKRGACNTVFMLIGSMEA